MQQKIYQVDAFSDHIFRGNPAAVCPLEAWLEKTTMQAIAAENNLSETAFFVARGQSFELRWFTPTTEVDLCGHATLAAAWVLFNELGYSKADIHFLSRSGELVVSNDHGKLTLDFPVQWAEACELSGELQSILNSALKIPGDNSKQMTKDVVIQKVKQAEDLLVLVRDEATVRRLTPDFALLEKLPLRGLIVTAPGDQVDFVSRWFGPKVGVNEDPVTGSAHTTLTPFWAERLNKTQMVARQISQRGGELECELRDSRVHISGYAVTYLEGHIFL